MTNIKRLLLTTMVTQALLTTAGCRSNSGAEDDPGFTRTPNYKYADLIVKDYDEMHGMVQSMVRKAQAAGEEGPAVEQLQSAFKLILSRPDSDNMVAKLVPEVRRELVGYGAFERVIAQLAAEATDNLRNKENTVSVRTTASFILENLITEIRPEVERENKELRDVFRRIADARLDLGGDVKSERKLRGMYLSKNPSEETRKIIKVIEEREKAREKAAKKKK